MYLKRKDILNALQSAIIDHGQSTEKIDVLEEDNRVYTKKIPVDIMLDDDGNIIKFASISSYDKEFSDVSVNDIRINIQKYNGDFLNLFAESLSDRVLNDILGNFIN